MIDQPADQRHRQVIVDVIQSLRDQGVLVNLLTDDSLNGAGADSIQLKEAGDDYDDKDVLVLVGLSGSTSSSESAKTMSAEYQVQIQYRWTRAWNNSRSRLWRYDLTAAVSATLGRCNAGGSMPTGEGPGIDPQWSEDHNRYLADQTFTFIA